MLVENTSITARKRQFFRFFCFMLVFRVVNAHRLRFIGHINVILLLNFDPVQIRTDLWSASLPFHLVEFWPCFSIKLNATVLKPFPCVV